MSCLGQNNHYQLSVLQRLFVKRFTLCYIGPLSVCPVRLQRWCIVAKQLDRLGCHLLLGKEVPLGSGHIVLHGDPAPPKRAQPPCPQFLAHVYCG